MRNRKWPESSKLSFLLIFFTLIITACRPEVTFVEGTRIIDEISGEEQADTEYERISAYINTGNRGALLASNPGDADSATVLLDDDSIVTLLAEQETINGVPWQHIQTEDGQTGWVASEFLTIGEPPATVSDTDQSLDEEAIPESLLTGVGTATFLFNNPYSDGRSLRELSNNDTVYLLPGQETVDGLVWQEVETEEGLVGWVIRDFLILGEPAPNGLSSVAADDGLVDEVVIDPADGSNPVGLEAADAVRGSLNGFEYIIHDFSSIQVGDDAEFFAKVSNVGSEVFVISAFEITVFDAVGNVIATDQFFTPGDIVPVGKTIPLYRRIDEISAEDRFIMDLVSTGPRIQNLDARVVEVDVESKAASNGACEVAGLTNVDTIAPTHLSLFEVYYNSADEIVWVFRQGLFPVDPGETVWVDCMYDRVNSSSTNPYPDFVRYEVIATAYYQQSHANP